MNDQQGHHARELDVVDLWLVFTRHWKLLAAFVVAGAVLSAAYALTRDPVHRFRTVIEIGTQVVDGRPELIETPESVKAKIEEGYLTAALREYYTAHPEDGRVFKVSASVPKESNVVVLASEATAASADALREIHEGAARHVVSAHERIVDVIRQHLKTRVVGAETGLEALRSEAAILSGELQRLDQRQANRLATLDQRIALLETELTRQENAEKLLVAQIAELEELLRQMRRDQPSAGEGVADGANAMTLLLINDRVRSASERLAALHERRDVRIPNERDRLAAEIRDARRQRDDLQNELRTERERFAESIAGNERQQRLREADIAEAQLRIDNLRATEATTLAAQSVRPVGSGAAIIVVLGVLLAGFLSIGVIVLLELARAARRRTAETSDLISDNDVIHPMDLNFRRELRKTAV